MKNTVLIYSGGMDSTVLLYHHRDRIKACLNFHYGSKHNSRERVMARENCTRLAIPFHEIDMDFIGQMFRSDLLQSGGEVPEGHYADPTMKRTVVPFRNGIMLSIACGFAESVDCSFVGIANHAGDHAIYPDCRQDFITPMSEAMKHGTYAGVSLFAPYTHLDKRQIGLLGRDHGVDYGLTWTCYKGGEIHCGKCGSCVERKEALEGFDPTEYLS